MSELARDIVIEVIAGIIFFVLAVTASVWLAEYVDYRQLRGSQRKKKGLIRWSLGIWAKFLRM